MKLFHLVCLLLLNSSLAHAQDARIDPYPLASIYKPSEVFTVTVNNQTVPVVDYNGKYDYAGFAMSDGLAEIVIRIPEGKSITHYSISPRKLNIPARIEGRELHFTISQTSPFIIKIAGLKELVLNADSAETDRPLAGGRGVFTIKAKPNSHKPATRAIQQAIDEASAFKGGIVYIPAGVYITGNLKLKSNTSVYLEPGAVLLFSGRKKDYTVHAHKVSQKRDITWWIATDSGAENIKIYGRGTLDGNGKFATEKGGIGNHILAIMAASNIELNGPLLRNSGAWGFIVVRSSHVRISNFRIFNRFDMGENDGMDIMESEDVLVQHGIGIALDDPFSTKTWKQDTDLCRNWPGQPKPQRNIVFDKLISWTYCYAFKIGQGVMQPQTNICFRNSVVYDAAVGIGVHHKWGTSYVENVKFENIDIERLSYQNDDHRTWCVLFLQNGDKKGSGPVSGIGISNINIYDAGRSPGKVKGVNESTTVSHVSFHNIKLMNSGKYAATLEEMNIRDTLFSRDIRVNGVVQKN